MSDLNSFDPVQFDIDGDKPVERQLIDAERAKYLAKGGTIKKIVPPYSKDSFYECDIYIPGEGSFQSSPGVKDTLVRKPRPEKKFGKK
jgi:hypothetical protein